MLIYDLVLHFPPKLCTLLDYATQGSRYGLQTSCQGKHIEARKYLDWILFMNHPGSVVKAGLHFIIYLWILEHTCRVFYYALQPTQKKQVFEKKNGKMHLMCLSCF